MNERELIRLPGVECDLEIERDTEGHLVAMRMAGREYLRVEESLATYDGGFVVMNEVEAASGTLRHVSAAGETWVEAYMRDGGGMPVLVDGVEIVRDDARRIIACNGPGGNWRYRYSGAHLIEIESPDIVRAITRDDDGRPVEIGCRGVYRSVGYDGNRRSDSEPLPANWHTDDIGRLWAVTRADGSAESIYLWDRFRCVARIDGPPGDPLAAVFSLDGTGTPVRIITRTGVTRVPRDAFGEGLMAHRGVPGLFSGAQHGGFVHYRARSFDPTVGAFDAPDPWHGGHDDPRRSAGYRGTLIVERPVAGPYTVCGYDPVGFADPTGTIAWYYLLSTLTWAFPNNILTWVGIELTINFWFSLFGCEIDRYFTGAYLHSERFDIGAFQLDGFMGFKGQVFTTQHIVWAPREEFENHAVISGFTPGAPVRPTYYGTFLRIVPSDSPLVLTLQGSIPGFSDSGRIGWARAGGRAEAFAPGLMSPIFPSGSFHIQILPDTNVNFPTFNIRGEMDAVLTEVAPANAFATGTLDTRLAFIIPGTGLGIAEGALILITNAANAADIVAVLSVEENLGTTLVRLSVQTLNAGTTGLRLRGLGAMQSTETLTAGAVNTHLNVTGTSAPYQKNDAVRMLTAGTVAGSAIVSGFEAGLNIDAPIASSMKKPFSVFLLTSSGPVRGAELTADPTVLNFPSDPVPAKDDFITVTRGAVTVAVAVTSNGPGRTRSVDRSVAAVGAAGNVSWQPYVRGSDLGARAGDPESTAVLTYAPIVRGTAPATGFIGLADSTNALTARTIASVDHDVMVLATVLPTTAPSMTVERYIPGSPDLNSLAATGQIVLALNQNGQLGGVALRLLQLGNTTLGPSVGASVAQGFSIAGQTASQAYQAVSVTAFNASDAVVVRNGGSDEIAVVRTIEMTLEVDRDMTLDASGLRLVQLAGSGPRYNATLITGLELAVAPTVAGVRVQMPRFFVGEIVQVRGTGMSTRLFRIGAVAGTRLTLTGDAPITAVAGIDVRRIIAGDPLTGGPFVAIEGTPVHAAADGTTRWIKFRFWNNTKIAGLGSVGIVSGGQTLPAIVASTLYDVTQPDPVANPMRLTVAATTNAGAVAVTQPVFVAGENVFVAWTGPASGNGQYVTGTVAGNVLNVTPAAGASAIPSNVTGITLRRLPVIDVTFTAPIAATGNAVEILALTVANAALIPSFTQESDNAISFASGGTNLTAPSANLVVVIPFAESAITSSGELTSGTVKAPDDPEHWEYNRREAVAEHELRHTQQYNWFGPIWFAAFPMWILDTVLAATTDIEKPAFSAFVSGALNRDANANTTKLTIANMNGIPFAKGDTVQLYKGSEHNEVKLGELAAGAFAVEGSVTIANGDVFVRRRASGQGIFSDVALGILRFGTPGSVMNLAMTLTWGSAFQLIGRAGYLIARLVDNGTLLDATVLNNGMSATLADPTKKGLLANEQRLIVRMKDITINRTVVGAIQDGRITLGAPIALSSDKDVTFDNEDSNRPVEAWFKATIETSGTSLKMKDTAQASQLSNVTNIKIRVNGDITVVRSITPPITDDGTITFGSELPAQSGSVKVAPYETHTPGTLQHWNNYYPATVNPDKLASVTLQAVGSDHLTLAPRDRVRVLYDGNDSFGFTTSVTSVTGDQVDLEQAMPTLPTTNVGEIIVRLAKIGRDDPTGWLDQRLVDDLYDAGWVRWLTDPFSQMHYTVQQHSRGSFWDYFSRVGRYLLGTSSWSFLPAFGWLMWDRVFRGSTPYLAFIEQDASEHSGDLYTSIGRLRGQATVGDGPEATMVVGDIAQYWFWPGTRWIVLPQNANGQQDAPGVHLPNELIAMPFVTAESGPAAPNNGNEPNNNALAAALVAGTTESGSALGDPFYLKNTTDPRDLPVAAGSAAFAADIATRGWVPMEQKIQRNMASYVAFSQPTTGTQRHRMTVRSGLSTPSQDRHAQDEGKQTMFYNIKVDDVTVTVNGVAVAEAGTVTLLQTQRARIAVMPNNDRRYRATVVRPADDQSLQQPEDLVLQARIVDTTADRPVEISRYYKYDPARDQYETGGLRGRGVHLPTDIDIAVRQLNVAVVSKPPVVAALPTAPTFSLYGSSPAGLNVGGEVFVLVAANVLVPGPVAINYTFPQPGSTIDPVVALTDVNGSAGAALRAFLGDGRPFRLAIAADDPPEQPANIQLSVTVGEPGNTSIVTATIPITGHFYAAALIYTVARGGSLLLLCGNIDLSPVTPLDTVAVTLIDGTPAPLVGGTDPELTFTVAGNQITINCNANAQVGKRRLLLTDSANAGNRARRTIEIV